MGTATMLVEKRTSLASTKYSANTFWNRTFDGAEMISAQNILRLTQTHRLIANWRWIEIDKNVGN